MDKSGSDRRRIITGMGALLVAGASRPALSCTQLGPIHTNLPCPAPQPRHRVIGVRAPLGFIVQQYGNPGVRDLQTGELITPYEAVRRYAQSAAGVGAIVGVAVGVPAAYAAYSAYSGGERDVGKLLWAAFQGGAAGFVAAVSGMPGLSLGMRVFTATTSIVWANTSIQLLAPLSSTVYGGQSVPSYSPIYLGQPEYNFGNGTFGMSGTGSAGYCSIDGGSGGGGWIVREEVN